MHNKNKEKEDVKMKKFRNLISKTALSLAMVMSISSSVSAGKFVGLANIGNSCYINSAIQILYADEDFRQKIDFYAEVLNDEELTIVKLKQLFDLMDACPEGEALEKIQVENIIKKLVPGLYGTLEQNKGGYLQDVVSKILTHVNDEVFSVGENGGVEATLLDLPIDYTSFYEKELDGMFVKEENGSICMAKAISINTGRHFVTYVRGDNGAWIEINDMAISVLNSENDVIERIRLNACIIEAILYENVPKQDVSEDETLAEESHIDESHIEEGQEEESRAEENRVEEYCVKGSQVEEIWSEDNYTEKSWEEEIQF